MKPVVLVVDDNAESLEMVVAILQARGFEVETASDGPTTLERIAARRPDVVVLDVVLPGMSGRDVLDRIRASPEHADIPVILVTGRTSDDDMLEGYKFGADYYIRKPFTPRQLLHGIGLVLGRRFPA